MENLLVRKVKAEEELRNRLRQQEIIARLGRQALGGLELSQLLDRTVQRVAKTLDVEICRIYQLDPLKRALLLAAHTGRGEGPYSEIRLDEASETMAGYTLDVRHAVVSPDLANEARFRDSGLVETERLASGICVAIRGGKQPYGVIQALSAQPQIFSPDDLHFLASIANVLAAAIERLRLEDETKSLNENLERRVSERTRLLQLLQSLTAAANQAPDVPAAMQSAVDLICSHTGWQIGHVFIPDENSPETLVSSSIWHLADGLRYAPFHLATQQARINKGQGMAGRVWATGAPVSILDLNQEDFLRAEPARQSGVQAGCAFPVLAGQEVVAVIEFFYHGVDPPGRALFDSLANIGTQLGRVVERERAEQSLRANEQRMAEAQRIAHLGSWEWDIASDTVTWSEELYRIYGLGPATFQASYGGFLERIPPEERQTVMGHVNTALSRPEGYSFEHHVVRPDGEVRMLRADTKVISDPAGKPLKLIGTALDVTESRRMQEVLQEQQTKLGAIVNSAPLILFSLARDGTITAVEGRGLGLIGLNAGALVGSSIYEQTQDAQILGAIERALAGQEVVLEQTIPESEVVYETRLTPICSEQGEVNGIVGVALDVTDRHQALQSLRTSEARFRTIFEGSALGKAIIDLEFRLSMTNQALNEMLGYTPAEMNEMAFWDLMPAADQERTHELVEPLFSGKTGRVQWEQRLMSKSGRLGWFHFFLSLVRKEDGSPRFVIAMVEDITAAKQMEAELAEVQQKLVAGREMERLHLAQELHDQPLQSLYHLLYQIDGLRDQLVAPEGALELEKIESNLHQVIDDIREICQDLRPPTLAPFGLEGAIREHAEGFQQEHPDVHVRLELMYDGQSLSEHLRLTLFRIYQQAMSNIVRHAQANNVVVRFVYNKDEAILEVEDDGRGFEIPRRWVELVRQNHLGLVGAMERAELIHGHLTVTSAPGKGTRVRIWAPLDSAENASSDSAQESPNNG